MAKPSKTAKKGAAPAKAAPAEDAGEGDGRAGKGKLLVIAGIVGAVLVVGGAGAGLYFSGLLGGGGTASDSKPAAVIEFSPPTLVDMPEKLVDLKTGTCQAPYLRFLMSVDVPKKAEPLVVGRQVEIMDAMQQLLRSRERHELVGLEGSDRLRNDARRIINEMIAPEQINGVLFKKFVLQ